MTNAANYNFKMRNSKSQSLIHSLAFSKLFLLLFLFVLSLRAQLNMDLDIEQGNSMTSTTNIVYKFSVMTSRVDAGTKVQVKIPFQLNQDGTSSQFTQVCKEAVFKPATNSLINNILTTCQVVQYSTFAAIEFTVGQAYTDISMYYFFVGVFKNPKSVQVIDSFEVRFTNGFPTGSQTTGLVLTYTPNLIYSSTLVSSDNQAGTKDTYVFTFKITNDIPRNGFLRLRFPSPWNNAPSNILALTTSIRIYGSERSGSYTVISPITSDVLYGGLFDLQGVTADPTKVIQITLSGIENPNFIVTTGSFQISTLDDAKMLIDQVSTGLTIVISRVGTLAVNFTIGNYTVESTTYLQLSMDSSAAYTTGGYIEIQSPSKFMNFTPTVRCNTIFGLTGSQQSCTLVAPNIVRYQRAISNKGSISISIESLILPLGVVRNDIPFKIYLKDAGGQVVSQNENVIQFSTVAGNCYITGATRSLSTLTVGNPNAQYQLNFICGHKIPAGGWISITLPEDQVAFQSTMECQTSAGTKVECRPSQNFGSTVLKISATDICKSKTEGCVAFEAITVNLVKALNPLFVVQLLTSSIRIQTFNQLDAATMLVIDELTSGAQFANQLRPGTISAISIARSGTNAQLTGGQVTYTFTFKTQTTLPNGAALRITFPVDTAFLDGSALTCMMDKTTAKICTSPVVSAQDSSIIQYIIVQSICTVATGCAPPVAGFTIDITSGLVNPFSNKPNTQVQFTLETLRFHLSQSLIDTGTGSASQMTLTPNQLTVNILQPASPIFVGAVTTYRFEVRNPNNLIPSFESSGRLEIQLPRQLDLLTDSCQAQTSTNIILDCDAVATSEKIIISSPGANINKNSIIQVTLVNSVRNPQSTAVSDAIQIFTYFQGNNLIDQSITRTVQADTPNQILFANVNRDTSAPTSVVSSAQFSFTTTNSLSQGGIIRVTVPDVQMTFRPAGSATITPSEYTIVTGSLVNSGTGSTTFSVVWCANPSTQTTCTSATTKSISFTIGGSVFQNPTSSRIPDRSIEILTLTSNGVDRIDSVTTNLNAQPFVSRGALTNGRIVRSNHIVGQVTQMAFEFRTQTIGSNLAAGSRINIILPAMILYQSGTTNPVCKIKDATNIVDLTNCVPTYVTDSLGLRYIKEIYAVISSCSVLTCAGGTSYIFSIDSVINPLNNKQQQGSTISVATMQLQSGSTTNFEVVNSMDLTIGSTQLPLTTLPEIQPGTMVSTRPVRGQVSVDKETTIDFSITLANRLGRGGYIKIMVPKGEFQLNEKIPQFKYLTGTNSGTTQSLTVFEQTTTSIVLLLKENCSGTAALFCAIGTQIRFQVTQGISNMGYLLPGRSSSFDISTLAADGTSIIDNTLSQVVTPDLQLATIDIQSIVQSTNQASLRNVIVDFTFNFGASVGYDDLLVITFDDTLMRKDSGDLKCFKVVGSGPETSLACNVESVPGTNNVNKISLKYCSTECDATTTQILRVKNVVNKLSSESYSGNVIFNTVQEAGTYQIGTGTFQMSKVAALIPGAFLNVVVTRSTTFQGQNADFTLKFTTAGYTLANSVLEIVFPKNQIALATGKTEFLIKAGTQVLAPKSTVDTQNFTTYVFDQWFCTPISPEDKCVEGLKVDLTISNAANPFVQSSVFTDSFLIQVRSLANNLLQSNANSVFAQPSLEFGKILNIGVTHENSQFILRQTTYQFDFTVQSSIPMGGKIRITYPPNRVLNGTGTSVCKVNEVVQSCTFSFANSQTQVTLTGICSASQCSGPLNFKISIVGGIKNPPVVVPIVGNFTIETLTQQNFVVSQGLLDNQRTTQILPEPFPSYSVQRSTQFMMADAEYRVTFQTVNPVPKGGFFRVIMPLDQVQVPSSGPICKLDIALTSLTCRVILRNSAEVWIDINSNCANGCAAGVTIPLLFEQLSNPSQFNSNFGSSSWKIYTMNANKELLDGVFTGVRAKPDLIGKQAVLRAISIEQPFAGRATFLKIGLIPGVDLTTEALLDVYFPDNLLLQRQNDNCATNLGRKFYMQCIYTFYPSGYVSRVTLSNPCAQFGCSATTTYFYDIPVFNRGDSLVISPQQWRAIFKYSYVDVSSASVFNTLTLQPEIITKYYLYNLGLNQIDAETPLFISFRPVNYIPTESERGRIRIVFPSQVRAILNQCQVRVDGAINNRNFKCTISRQVATITHSYQDGSLIGKNLTMEARLVVNPNTTKPSDPFQLITEWDVNKDGTYAKIDQNLVDLTWQVTVLTQLYDAQITRLPLNDDRSGYRTGQPTQLLFYLKLRHKLESTSNIIVTLPPDAQLSILPTAAKASSCFSSDSVGGKNLNQLLCEVNQTARTVTVRNYCQVQGCQARDEVRFKLMETFMQNYHQIVSPLNEKTDSVVITTTTREGIYFIDTADAGIFVQPEIEPTQLMMPSPEILRTNNIINRRVNWVFSFKTNKNPVPKGGYLNMTIPRDVLITVTNSSIDLINYDTGAKYWNFTYKLHPRSTSSVDSVREIILWNLCNGTNGCQTGASYSFTIDWIKNPVAQINVRQPVVIELRTPQGYLVERGTTQPVAKLFSELIPARLQNLQLRAVNPEPMKVTEYEIIFSADAEFSKTDVLTITFPPEFNFTTSRQLQQSNSSKCKQVFTGSDLSCTINKQAVKIAGAFTDNNKQYGVRVAGVVNPNVTGPSQALIIEVANQAGQNIASRSTLSRVNILEPINKTECNQVCGSCSGTNSTCTSCAVPSKYPLFKDGKCVDTCSQGFFFDALNLRCVQCAHACETCFKPGDRGCLRCADGYYMEDGLCKPWCSKTLLENPIIRACTSSYKERCSQRCLTCSLNPEWCLSCDIKSNFPVLDRTTGRCLPRNQSLCGNGAGRFYIDKQSMECRVCSELCKACEDEPERCTECWSNKFQSRSVVNELYETCVEKCGLGTYYDKPNNTCRYCNPVCLTCNGQRPDQCQVCNKTPEARQLYLLDNKQCVISCPKTYNIETHNSTCVKAEVQVVSFSFLFLFVAVFVGTLIVAASLILTKGQNKTVDIFYAIVSIVEFINRLCLLGNLFMKSDITGVFPLSVCFMNLIATSSLGLFFNLLFMTPIYAHSPHFRQLWKLNHRKTYFFIEWLCYLAGVNAIRLVYSGFMDVKAFKSDLNNWKFFTVPLNMMSNYTMIFTLFQLALNIFVVLFLSVTDDAFVLAALGLGLNTLLATLQLFKHLTTTRAQDIEKIEKEQNEQQQHEEEQMGIVPKAHIRMAE